MKAEKSGEGTLIVIPARGGSKRLPRKNILDFNGKPLIAWTIEQAIDSGIGDKIIVTSDDTEILAIAEDYSDSNVVPYKRPNHLGSDTATTADVILDVIFDQESKGINYNTLVLLQVTSPLRTATDVKCAHDTFGKNSKRDTVISVCKLEHPTAWCGTITKSGIFTSNLIRSKRSQEYVQEYRPNGAIYVSCVKNLVNNKMIFTNEMVPYLMPVKRSFDIDEEIDFRICEYLHSQEG